MGKSSTAFDNALAIISIAGFFIIFLNAYFGVDLASWQTSILMIVAGAGLMYEGRVTTIGRWASNGLQGHEFAYLFTIIFGLFSIVLGVLALPSINLITPQLQGVIGITSVASIVFIVVQKWVVN